MQNNPFGNRYGGPLHDRSQPSDRNFANDHRAAPDLGRVTNVPSVFPGLGGMPPPPLRSRISDGTTSSSSHNTALGGLGDYSTARNGGSTFPHPNNSIANNELHRSYQASQHREAGAILRPESAASNRSFATQMPNAFTNGGYKSYNGGQNLPLEYSNGGSKPYTGSQAVMRTNADSFGVQPAQYRMPYSAQNSGALQPYQRDEKANDDSLSTSFGGIRLSDNYIQDNRYSNGNNDSWSDRSRQDSLVSTRSPSAHMIAESIKSGQAEDPFDRSMRRYDTPIRLPYPTIGLARFTNTKMFSIADSMEDGAATTTTSFDIPRKASISSRPVQVPDWLGPALQGHMIPTLEEAFDAIPLTELPRRVYPSACGVIRISGVPYGTTRQEMIAFIGRNAQIARQPEGSPYHAVHILMERESGKTLDCFIEVATSKEAAWVARQFARRTEAHRQPKVGDRAVEVIYSSQDELMAELFPRAKHVRWTNGQLLVDTAPRQYYEDSKAAGFQGFLHPEELVAMAKHANLFERVSSCFRPPPFI